LKRLRLAEKWRAEKRDHEWDEGHEWGFEEGQQENGDRRIWWERAGRWGDGE
jgi:hypothetical protein